MSKVGFQDHSVLDTQGLNGKRIVVKGSRLESSNIRTTSERLPKAGNKQKIKSLTLSQVITDDVVEVSIPMHPVKKRKLARTMRRENVRMGLKR